MSLKLIESGIYQDSRTGHYYERPWINGRRTHRRLRSRTLAAARLELAAHRTAAAKAKAGLAPDPYSSIATVGRIAAKWLSADCPNKSFQPRTGRALTDAKHNLDKLLPFFAKRDAATLTIEDCSEYHVARLRQIEKGTGHRTVDLELATLSAMLTWASVNSRKTGLRLNPLAKRLRFQTGDKVIHSTARSVQTDEQFHALAAYLLGTKASSALGWQLLLEGLTGCRTIELLRCRLDAKGPGEAGYSDATALHIARAKHGIEPWALLDVRTGLDPMRQCLIAFKAWRKTVAPRSPWFIPGKDGIRCASAGALTHALRHACKDLNMPHVSSHGLRAYYVRVLRSQGIDDSEISKRLGHRSGVILVEQTYGTAEPGWFNKRVLDFLPKDTAPAWTPWLPNVPLPCATTLSKDSDKRARIRTAQPLETPEIVRLRLN